MGDDIVIRTYKQGDEASLVKLLKESFNNWPHFDLNCTSHDHWKWKYLDNPLNIKFIVLGEKDGEMITCFHSIPVQMKIGDDTFHCGLPADAATHKDYRSKGIWRKIRYFNLDTIEKAGFDFFYVITSNPFLYKSLMRSNPRFPHSILNLVRIKDIDKQLQVMPLKNRNLIRLGFYASKALNNIKNYAYGAKLRNGSINVNEINTFDDRINTFLERISKHYDFIIKRDKDYLNWRYIDSRSGGFVVKKAEEAQQILGYIVFKVNKYHSNYPMGFIIDLLTLPDRHDVAIALVEDAVNYFDRNDINFAACQVIKNHPNEKVLNRYGFLNSRINLKMFFDSRMMSKVSTIVKKIKIIPANKIHFSYGDLDSLPIEMPDYL